MKKRTLVLLLAALVMLVSTQAMAFDDARKGFMLGLGAGLGSAKWTLEGDSGGVTASASESWTGFHTDFKIGGGVSDKVFLYYSSRQVFFSADVVNEFTDVTETFSFVQGIGGVGVSYFLQPSGPSFYFNGVVGLGAVMDLDESETESAIGLGVGVGYEFSSHWAAEVNFMGSTLESLDAGDVSADWKISNIMFSVNWLAY